MLGARMQHDLRLRQIEYGKGSPRRRRRGGQNKLGRRLSERWRDALPANYLTAAIGFDPDIEHPAKVQPPTCQQLDSEMQPRPRRPKKERRPLRHDLTHRQLGQCLLRHQWVVLRSRCIFDGTSVVRPRGIGVNDFKRPLRQRRHVDGGARRGSPSQPRQMLEILLRVRRWMRFYATLGPWPV